MLRRFPASLVLAMFTACGGEVGNGGNAGHPSLGGSPNVNKNAVSTGGSTVDSTSAAGGSTGLNGYCDGLLPGQEVCSVQPFANVSTCDIALQETPADISKVGVVVDCAVIAQVAFDAGTADGYYIDYSEAPAHLKLTGSVCTAVSTYGAQHVFVIMRCGPAF